MLDSLIEFQNAQKMSHNFLLLFANRENRISAREHFQCNGIIKHRPTPPFPIDIIHSREVCSLPACCVGT